MSVFATNLGKLAPKVVQVLERKVGLEDALEQERVCDCLPQTRKVGEVRSEPLTCCALSDVRADVVPESTLQASGSISTG